uniref:Uncharacterized protein n=1 Tax=Timema genevievae TaxID=629358 RepID=A0A7R9JST1_TIMGE|nr:unnamed protein product [Timema genevievae]
MDNSKNKTSYSPTSQTPYEKPAELTKWETFKHVLWDPETRQFLGRTAKSWELELPVTGKQDKMKVDTLAHAPFDADRLQILALIKRIACL